MHNNGEKWNDNQPGSQIDSRISPVLFSPVPPHIGSSQKPAQVSTVGWGRRLCGFVLVCGREEGIPVDVDLGNKK